jgi:hypothetical protein
LGAVIIISLECVVPVRVGFQSYFLNQNIFYYLNYSHGKDLIFPTQFGKDSKPSIPDVYWVLF